MSATLKGMTWDHPRGYDPMVATSRAWKQQTGVEIVWDKRSLQDFETFPVEELARQYDLIVIDHPHVGQITAEECLVPLDIAGCEAERAELATHSVGQSYPSYGWDGRQWAFPIDAASQVQVYRADRIDRPAQSWNEVILLAKAGHVVVPMLAPHSLMTFYTLAANLGHPCATGKGDFIDAKAGVEVVSRLAELTAVIAQSNFAMDPIAASEAMAHADPVVTLMPFGYGYANYALAGFRPGRLKFADIPLPGAKGSALGGTGIAVSAFSDHKAAAIDYAYWVASGDVQRGIYSASGGQPGHAAAWEDDAVNAPVDGFYRDTRKTLEGAYVRPRHNGYMAFQDAASRRLNAGLLGRENARAIVDAINAMFEETF
jgi:multiple sugar transport system substrate-binding protein